ncbi:MAG: UDP-N-acetylglucosamine 2-epimerase [Patescibacteria group bacterium]
MKKKRKICVFSGKRGGLGAYSELIKLIEKDPGLELQLLLSDMHASPQFGKTVDEANNLFPKSKIEVIDIGTGRGDSAVIRAENLGLCLTRSVSVLNKLRPDIVLVHADRGEHLMIAFAALSLNIPIAHTQGGESSGNVDDVQRHAITKLAHIHFPETKRAAQIVRSLGEESWRIHTVGSVYIDRIIKRIFTVPKAAAAKYAWPGEDFFITIYHPETMKTSRENYEDMKLILGAIKSLDFKSVLLYPCSDPGYEGIIKAIHEVDHDSNFKIYKNIENLDFLGLMAAAKAMIGNSSGALVEAPYLKLPAVNIGHRQTGRSRSSNVVDSNHNKTDVIEKIRYVLANKIFRQKLKNIKPHLGDGRASERIVKILKSVKINRKLLEKRLS